MSYIKQYVENRIEELNEQKQWLQQKIYVLNQELAQDKQYNLNGKPYSWVAKNKKLIKENEDKLKKIDQELKKYQENGLCD
jgi:hypothetical protein